MKKISVVINKNWEAEPVLNSLASSAFRPADLPFPKSINSPRDGNNKMTIPRAVIDLEEVLRVTVWCIQDLMSPLQSSSSTEEKYKVLPPILQIDEPDLVIAIGTAGYPSEDSLNGSIIIGGNFFIHNGNPNNPGSKLTHPDIGKMLTSNVNEKLYGLVSNEFKNKVEPKFIRAPQYPANSAVCIASQVFTALSSINVTDYSEYNWVDHEAIEHFKQAGAKFPFNSLETTHGVIKLSTSRPIIFLSAITDRLGFFDIEVTPTQNYVASFNAGIVLGQLLVSLKNFDEDFAK